MQFPPISVATVCLLNVLAKIKWYLSLSVPDVFETEIQLIFRCGSAFRFRQGNKDLHFGVNLGLPSTLTEQHLKHVEFEQSMKCSVQGPIF